MQRVFLVPSLVAALCVAGCSDILTGGELIRDDGPTGTIIVVNGTGVTIEDVLISHCDASTYGLDRLPGGGTLPPGQSASFTVSAGCWDVYTGAIGYGDARQRMDVAPYGTTRYTVTR